MGYQADIYSALTNAGGITSLVGTRIYPDIADKDAVAPYIVYQTVTTGGTNSHDGERAYVFPLVQFSCWAQTKAGALALASAVAAVLDGNTIDGNSDCSFQFANQSPNYDLEARLFGEVIEYSCAALNI